MATELPKYPATRVEKYLAHIAQNGGGGGVSVEPLSVTKNGIYEAPDGTAYSPVSVAVPVEGPDLSGDTVDVNAVLAGYTFHDADGEEHTGEVQNGDEVAY